MTSLDLRALWEGQDLDIPSALNKSQTDTIEVFLHYLVRLPLEDHHMMRVDVGRSFRLAIQSPLSRQPHGIKSFVRTAKKSHIESIEARLLQIGGTRAVVAYVIAGKRDSRVVEWVHALSDQELSALLRSTADINDHKHFTRLVHTVDDESDDGDEPASTDDKHVRGPRYNKRQKHNTAKSNQEDTRRRAKLSRHTRQPTSTTSLTPNPAQHRSTKTNEAGLIATTTHNHPSALVTSPLMTNSTPCTTGARAEAAFSADRRDQMNGEHVVAAGAHDGPVNSGPRDRFDDPLVPPYPGNWYQGPQLESSGSMKCVEIDNLFHSETIMEPNFDEAFPTGGIVATTDDLDAFDASQVMTTDFDVWAMQTTDS